MLFFNIRMLNGSIAYVYIFLQSTQNCDVFSITKIQIQFEFNYEL